MTLDFVRRVALGAAAVACSVSGTLAEPVPGRFDVMLQRPLFSPGRRPPAAVLEAPAFAPPPAPALPPPDITLSGIITGAGVGVALIRRPQDVGPVRVTVGGQIGGWTVAEIRPRAVVLRHDARTVTVDLPTPSR